MINNQRSAARREGRGGEVRLRRFSDSADSGSEFWIMAEATVKPLSVLLLFLLHSCLADHGTVLHARVVCSSVPPDTVNLVGEARVDA